VKIPSALPTLRGVWVECEQSAASAGNKGSDQMVIGRTVAPSGNRRGGGLTRRVASRSRHTRMKRFAPTGRAAAAAYLAVAALTRTD
jgi:hypothetical protein